MTLATTPTAQITGTPHFSQIADTRWRYWRGPVSVYLASGARRVTATFLQLEHREWLVSLLAHGIPLGTIRRLDLDDPREPRATLQQRVDSFSKRKRRYHNADAT
jgi:hypothetical protein